MNKEKSFAKELEELINRHSIDAKFNKPDFVLANYLVDMLNGFGIAINSGIKKPENIVSKGKPEIHSCKGCPFTEICPDVKMKTQPEPENKKEYKKPEAFDVPKEVQAMAEFFGEMFPGSKVEIHRVEMPRRNPRDKRRAKNKRNGGRRNETR